MLSDIFGTLVAKVLGGLSLALAIALVVVVWRADVISGKLEDKRDELAREEARHAVTRQSVGILEGELAKFIGAGKASRVAKLASIEAQAKDSARLQQQADVIRAEMATQAEGDPCDCSTPGSIINAEGL